MELAERLRCRFPEAGGKSRRATLPLHWHPPRRPGCRAASRRVRLWLQLAGEAPRSIIRREFSACSDYKPRQDRRLPPHHPCYSASLMPATAALQATCLNDAYRSMSVKMVDFSAWMQAEDGEEVYLVASSIPH